MNRSRLLAKLLARLAVAEAAADAADARVDGQHGVVGGEEQHAVRADVPELRQRLDRPPRCRQRTANRRWQPGRSAEDVDAGAQRAQPVFGVGAGELHALFELFLWGAPHGVGRERGDALQRRERRITLARRRMDRQHFPDKQRERIARQRRERSVKTLERRQRLLEPCQKTHSEGTTGRPHVPLRSLRRESRRR